MHTASYIALALGLSIACGPLRAASTSFAVQAVVVPGCVFVGQATTGPGAALGRLDFGSHPALAAAQHGATVSLAGSAPRLQCTPGADVSMRIDEGRHAVQGQRRMRAGAHYLPYTLSAQPDGSALIAPGAALPVDATAGPTLLPVHGRVSVPSGGVPAGHYTDTLQILFSW